ncbi:hypothetical protein, partial [Ralstonia mannitolilytica]
QLRHDLFGFVLLLGHSNVLLRLNSLLQGGPLFRGQTSSSQLLALLEQQFKLPGSLSEVLRKVSALRVDADHKILNRDEKPSTYSEQFAALCSQATAAVEELAGALTPSTE